MTSDNIYPGMLIRNCHGDIGWVLDKSPIELVYRCEWNYGSVFVTSAGKILEDHQRLLDYERANGL